MDSVSFHIFNIVYGCTIYCIFSLLKKLEQKTLQGSIETLLFRLLFTLKSD